MSSLSGEKTIEYRTWLPKDIHEFVLFSYATPSLEDFGLKYPNGYALAIIRILKVDSMGDEYGWYIAVEQLIKPFRCKGKLHFFDVPDNLINLPPDLTDARVAYLENKTGYKADQFISKNVKPAIEIAIKEMPKKYKKAYRENAGNWNVVESRWLLSKKEYKRYWSPAWAL